MLGETLAQVGLVERIDPPYFSVKAPVFPFNKFHVVDTLLGPEIKSTGDRRGHGRRRAVATAFAKAMIGAGNALPREGKVFVSVRG